MTELQGGTPFSFANKPMALVAVGLHKHYIGPENRLDILRGITLRICEGESVCIVGASGAGKSTLMHILGTLDRPNSGQLEILGQSVLELNDETLSHFRGHHIGFVFQFHFLMPELTAVENVTLPLRLAGASKAEATAKASALLGELGLSGRLRHFPSELSGGERQRVALARALIQGPKILFADEPTGNLDSVTSRQIQDLLFEWRKKLGFTLVVVTHDPQFAKRFERIVRIQDGQVQEAAPV